MRGTFIIIIQNKTNCFEYSTENQEKEDKPKKEEEVTEPVVEEKPKSRSSQPKEAAPSFMLSIFAFLEVYLTKLLVSPHTYIMLFKKKFHNVF